MNKKEFAVGEVFQFGLKKLKVEECNRVDKCLDCSLEGLCKNSLIGGFVGDCMEICRDDETEVIFIEVEDEE